MLFINIYNFINKLPQQPATLGLHVTLYTYLQTTVHIYLHPCSQLQYTIHKKIRRKRRFVKPSTSITELIETGYEMSIF